MSWVSGPSRCSGTGFVYTMDHGGTGLDQHLHELGLGTTDPEIWDLKRGAITLRLVFDARRTSWYHLDRI